MNLRLNLAARLLKLKTPVDYWVSFWPWLELPTALNIERPVFQPLMEAIAKKAKTNLELMTKIRGAAYFELNKRKFSNY
jgi:hypothetical protein